MSSGTPNPYRTRRPGGGRAPARRRGRRSLLPLGIAAWALLEIWLLTLVGQAAGGMTVFLLLAAGVVLGAAVIQRAGRRAWRRLTAGLHPHGGAGADPERTGQAPRGGNGLTMLGGLLLMLPGLVSDAVGLLCVFPPTARLLRRGGARYLRGASGPLGAAFQDARRAEERMRAHRPDGRVVPGEVVRDDQHPDRPGPGEDRP